MEAFEALLEEQITVLRRFVHFKISDYHDAEDVLQEICVAAARGFAALSDPAAFKPWLLGIARHKCNDYYRAKARRMELPLEAIAEHPQNAGLSGRTAEAVRDTLSLLGDKEKQILYLYYFRQYPQERIAALLGIPLGTVKSRLHSAKASFRSRYPYPPKGERTMKKMPDFMPEYAVNPLDKPPFPVRWEEVMGWFIVPRLGEKLTWAAYDWPERRRTETMTLQVTGKAQVHGIEGVEIACTEYDPMECNSAGGQNPVSRTLVAQLTDTHCRLLAESHTEDGVKRYYTFLDGDEFLNNWGFGEDNCGNEIALKPKGDITRSGSTVIAKDKTFLLDVVGRYAVTINGKTYDTVCVADCYTYQDGVFSEQFLDRNGRTILWRRFNRNDWQAARYGKPWTELLPENERVTVNGTTYVHWYDCITDYIL